MIGRTNAWGGGGLNFSVVGGETLPSDHAENTIWVKTSVDITSYIFSATEPTAHAKGMVWIIVGTSSTVEFNALKKNAIQVYPVSAKQYVGGAWVDVTAMSYIGGELVAWTKYLYHAGNEYESITGGWTVVNTADGSVSKNADGISIAAKGVNGNTSLAFVHTANKVDLTDVSTIRINDDAQIRKTSGVSVRFAVYSSVPNFDDMSNNIVAGLGGWSGLSAFELDVSALTGEYYILFGSQFNGNSSYSIELNLKEVVYE